MSVQAGFTPVWHRIMQDRMSKETEKKLRLFLHEMIGNAKQSTFRALVKEVWSACLSIPVVTCIGA